MTKLVRDLMHRGLITCRQNAALGQVAVLLTQHHVHALVVVDRDRRPLGIMSDYDLLAGEWLSADFTQLPAALRVAAATRRTLRRIIGFAFAYNSIGIALAASGVLHPVAAALLMLASSLTVTTLANALPKTGGRHSQNLAWAELQHA